MSRLACPVLTRILSLIKPIQRASASMSSALALPSSAGALTATFTRSPYSPLTAVRAAEGETRNPTRRAVAGATDGRPLLGRTHGCPLLPLEVAGVVLLGGLHGDEGIVDIVHLSAEEEAAYRLVIAAGLR